MRSSQERLLLGTVSYKAGKFVCIFGHFLALPLYFQVDFIRELGS